jgi:hypothetical protein
MFTVCVLFRINCFYCTEKAGRVRFRKWKYNKLTNRASLAIVMRAIVVVFVFTINIMDTKALTDMNAFSRRR